MVWCFGVSAFVGVSEILKAELLAILFGLRLCWDRGCRKLIVLTDSQLTLSLVLNGCGLFHVYVVVLSIIKEFLARDWLVRFEHILREGNAVADLLAKDDACADLRFQCLEAPPLAALLLLADDYRGTSFLRP